MEKDIRDKFIASRTRRHQDDKNGKWEDEWRVYWTYGRITTAKQILTKSSRQWKNKQETCLSAFGLTTHSHTDKNKQTNVIFKRETKNKPTQTLGHILKNSNTK